MKKINTFIIGAQKAGTTSLYDWLGQHPQVNAPVEIKDYHFFDIEDRYSKGVSELASFYKKNDSKIQLHAAVNYMYFGSKVAKRIYEYNSEAKLIVCLREPVARAISAYRYFVRIGSEKKTFAEALKRERDLNVIPEEESDFTYLEHGKYIDQINHFLEYFPKGQILFVFFENLVSKNIQSKELSNIFKYLDIDDTFGVDYTHLNNSGQLKVEFVNRFLKEDHFFKKFKTMIPYSVRKKLGNKIEELNISDKKIEVDISSETKSYMEAYFRASIDELSNLCECDLGKIWNLEGNYSSE